MKVFIVFLLILNGWFTYMNIQNDRYNDLILGKWHGVKKETKKGNDRLSNGKLNKEISIYEFKKNNIVIDYSITPNLLVYKYYIKNNILYIDNLSFKIEKLTEKELIIIDFKEKDPDNPLVFRHYFVK